jgi:predicted nucleotidyltransferase component of viral defense system
MAAIFLHDHKDFADLLRITADEMGIEPVLVEKDYWIMHVLYGLKQLNYPFELKGGTSLSKGFRIIDRFSEDLDIHIKPPEHFKINENPKNIKEANVKARREFYDWLAMDIRIPGIVGIERDEEFDDKDYYRSGGIRLHYSTFLGPMQGVKEGILLEAGFDNVTPNEPLQISSWAYDIAMRNSEIEIIDNRAAEITCYHPGYTFVEKLQTITSRFRQEQADGKKRSNYMRQYYDVYCLLGLQQVQDFIGTNAYKAHKDIRFSTKDKEVTIQENQAFLLDDERLRNDFAGRYAETKALYYKGQPPFEAILKRIQQDIEKL